MFGDLTPLIVESKNVKSIETSEVLILSRFRRRCGVALPSRYLESLDTFDFIDSIVDGAKSPNIYYLYYRNFTYYFP